MAADHDPQIHEPGHDPADPHPILPEDLRRRVPAPSPQPGPGIGIGSLLAGAVLSLVMGGVGAWGYLNYIHPQLARNGILPAQPSADETGTAANPVDSRLEELNTRLDRLQARVDKQPGASPMPDLEPINQRLSVVDDLSRKVEAQRSRFGALPEKIDENARKITSVMADLEVVRNDLASLRSESRPAKSVAAETTAAEKKDAAQPARPADGATTGSADDEFGRGAEQFRKGQFKEAGETFERLTRSQPDDARVWYFAALARGFSSNDWKGETERLVKQGVERERAGKPDQALIDAAFSDLAKGTKDWLAYYRRTAGNQPPR